MVVDYVLYVDQGAPQSWVKDSDGGFNCWGRPLPKGFCFNSDSLTADELKQLVAGRALNEDLVYVHEDNDPILHAVITYFKKEAEIMNYTPLELLHRLTQFCAQAFGGIDYVDRSYRKENYYLGSILLGRMWVCRHRALLLKALYDAVKKSEDPSLFLKWGSFGKDGHVWTQITIDSQRWIFDPQLYLARSFAWDDASLALRKKYHL